MKKDHQKATEKQSAAEGSSETLQVEVECLRMENAN
jgi:hypothetical protein